MKRHFSFFFSLFLCLCGCSEQGLNPDDVTEPGFGGSISFVGKLPPADSLYDIRVVAVPYFPIDSSVQLLILKVIEGTIPFGENLKSAADSGVTVKYELFVKPKTYFYVAVVQQYGIDVFSQWKVVGIHGYSAVTPTQKSVTVRDGKFSSGVDFIVDFYNLPPQPFKVP